MKTILYTEFGSTIYGTSLPTSDKDYKAIFIPDAKDIVLQRAPGTIVQNTKENPNSKNTADDVDIEMFSLHRYLDLLMQGQTVALDILFAGKEFHKQSGPIWEELYNNRKEFLHSGVLSFIGYANQQAGKYGTKGSRVAALRIILEFLNKFPINHKLNHIDVLFELYPLVYKDPFTPTAGDVNEFIKIVEIKGPNGKVEQHLEVCNRKVPFHATIKYTKDIFQKIFDNYGARALAAEKNIGVDYKALYHAVRVCCEAKELLTTGNITFPRPEAPLLLQIRKGELPYKEVATLIENGLDELKLASETSILPKEPNRKFAEEFIENVYSSIVVNDYGYEQ